MSLNKFKNTQLGIDIGLEIGCANMSCTNLICTNMDMPIGANIEAHDISVGNNLEVVGDAVIAGNNYATPDLGQNNYSLHTDGAGATFWSPDSTGDGDITYNGVPPTVVGQFVKFSAVDGSTVNQSVVVESLTDLNVNDLDINGANIIDCAEIQAPITKTNTINEVLLDNGVVVDGVILKDGLVDGVDVSQLETDFQTLDDDYKLNIDQPVKIASNPTFNSLLLNDGLTFKDVNNIVNYFIENDDSFRLAITNSGNAGEATKIEILGNKIQQYQSFNSAEGVRNFGNVSRGTLSAPTALLIDHNIVSSHAHAYDSVDYKITSTIEQKTSENQTVGNNGGKIVFSTVDNGTTTNTVKMTIDENVNIGISPNNYTLPTTSSGVADQSVMVYNATTKNMDFKVQSGFMLGFGGNINSVPARAEAWGDANLSTNDTPGADNSMIVPIDCKLLAIAYNTTNGDNTTTVNIMNGVTIVWNFNLVGASGVEDTIDNLALLFSKGDRLTVRVTGGTTPGQSNFAVYMK